MGLIKIIKSAWSFRESAREMKKQEDAVYEAKSKEIDNLIFMQ